MILYMYFDYYVSLNILHFKTYLCLYLNLLTYSIIYTRNLYCLKSRSLFLTNQSEWAFHSDSLKKLHDCYGVRDTGKSS